MSKPSAPPTPERRFTTAAAPTATGRSVYGYAAKFNSRSANLGTTDAPWFEIISPGAFDGRLGDNVVALFNHDNNLILARSKAGGSGTLKLKVDNVGLFYQFEAPNTSAGNDLLESIKRGDVDSSSFSFQIAAGGDQWQAEGKGHLRTITKFSRLYDVSPVTSPAYPSATVSARSKPPISRALDITRRRLALLTRR